MIIEISSEDFKNKLINKMYVIKKIMKDREEDREYLKGVHDGIGLSGSFLEDMISEKNGLMDK